MPNTKKEVTNKHHRMEHIDKMIKGQLVLVRIVLRIAK
jgi:hypothetical protein